MRHGRAGLPRRAASLSRARRAAASANKVPARLQGHRAGRRSGQRCQPRLPRLGRPSASRASCTLRARPPVILFLQEKYRFAGWPDAVAECVSGGFDDIPTRCIVCSISIVNQRCSSGAAIACAWSRESISQMCENVNNQFSNITELNPVPRRLRGWEEGIWSGRSRHGTSGGAIRRHHHDIVAS